MPDKITPCLYEIVPKESNRLTVSEILRRIAVSFRRVEIDWIRGEQSIEERLTQLQALEAPVKIIDYLVALKSHVVRVDISDTAGELYGFDLHDLNDGVEISYAVLEGEDCRSLFEKLASILDYDFRISVPDVF